MLCQDHARPICDPCHATRCQERRQFDVILGYPTPVTPDGHCWFCSGGLGHGPNGHKPDCVWVAAKIAQPAPHDREDEQR